jgi:major membrane immunogen (membrane-anchored lipoprotein)
MIVKKLIGICAMAASAVLLQACGGDDVAESFFMVTNTNQGHVCIYDSAVKAKTAEAQEVATVLYTYYGYRGGEQDLYSGDVGCGLAKSIGARDPDVIISNDFYLKTIVPAFNARK